MEGESTAAFFAGQIRGGGGKAGEEAEKAIEAIRDAKNLLGEGPRFSEVDASAINAGKKHSRHVHIHHQCGPRQPVVSLATPLVASLQDSREPAREPGRYFKQLMGSISFWPLIAI